MRESKELKKKFKERKGITLIALVITIIVLLILAGVSIMMLTGDNSILNQATNAKNNTIEGQEKEAISVAYHGVLTDKLGVPEGSVFETALQNELSKNGFNVEVSSNGKKIKFNDTQHVYKLDIARGTVTGPVDPNAGPTLLEMVEAGKTCENPASCTDDTHVHIGEFINYAPSNETATATVEETETGYSNSQTYAVDRNTQWRVLGISADGEHVLLTTESPIKKSKENDAATNDPYLVLQGARGYASCIPTLNKICGIYANDDLGTARSITMEDINAALGVVVVKDANGVPTSVYESAEQVAEGEEHTNKDYVKIAGMQDTYTYTENSYALENYLGTGTKYKDDTIYRNAYGYLKNNIFGDSSYDKYTLQYANNTAKEIIFKGTDSGDCAKAYWVASPGVYSDGSGAGFGPGRVYGGIAACGDGNLFGSYGGWGARGLAVRPVVSLDSEVTLEDVGGIDESGTVTPDWTIPDGVKGPNDSSRVSGNCSEEENRGQVTARPQP